MKYRPSSLKLSNARMTSGRRQLQSLRGRLRLQMMRINELEARSYLQEAALLAVLRHLDFRFTTFPDAAPPTRH